MPAFSGLYNGVFGENYAPITKPRPPISGILHVLLQKRGLYGMVRGFGRNSPTVVGTVDMNRNDMLVRGGWEYATRTDDVANRVTITHIGGDVNNIGTEPVPANASADWMKLTADTVLNRAYAADKAATGATGPALAERRDT